MQKIILTLFFIIELYNCFAQSANQNFNKYWYYRDRLKKRFMVEGANNGQSLVAEGIRTRINSPSFNTEYYYDFADQTINMGWYLGVLGTEYGLLAKNNLSTNNTASELYNALKALERLDYVAESMVEFKNGNSVHNCGYSIKSRAINGYFERGDIGEYIIGGDHTIKGFDKDLAPELNKKIFCNKKNYNLNSYDEDPPTLYHGIPDPDCLGVGNEMSQDQAYRILMGLALIYKFVPNNATYNGMNFSQEAHDEAIEILDWIRNSHQLANPSRKYDAKEPVIPPGKWYSFIKAFNWNNTTPWTIVSPVSEISVRRGPWCQPYSYGLANCYRFFRGGYPNHDVFSFTEGRLMFQCMAYSNGVGVVTAALKSDDECFADIVAAIGSCWKTYPATILSTLLTGVPLPSVGIPWTQQELDLRTNLKDMQFYALLHACLHNKTTLISQNVFRAQIDAAPACGPFNIHNPHYIPFTQPAQIDYYTQVPDVNGNLTQVLGWNTYNRFNYYPSERSIHANQEEYNGLDYMLYFNLYNLYFPNYNSKTNDPNTSFFNKMDYSTSVNFPVNRVGFYIGSTTIPYKIEAFNSITYNGTVSTNNGHVGNLTMHAGNDIHLANGTHIGAGLSQTTFFYHAYAQPFCCSNSSQSYARTTDTSGNDGSGYDMTNDDSLMYLFADKDTTPHEWTVIPNMDEEDIPDSLLQYVNDSIVIDSSLIRLYKGKQNTSNLNPEITALTLFPNPFASETKLTFFLNSPQKINIYLYNPLGQLVNTITENEKSNSGIVTYTIKRDELPSGIYQLQLKTENGVVNKQLVIQ